MLVIVIYAGRWLGISISRYFVTNIGSIDGLLKNTGVEFDTS